MLQREITEPRHGPAQRAMSRGDDAVEIQIARLMVEDGELHALAALLSDDERARATRFVFDRDRRRFIIGRARLRQLLAGRLDVPPGTISFVRGAHGKPALADRFRDSRLCFNLSHCDDLAVYAFVRGRDVGIDVEAVRPLPDADTMASRFFSTDERAAYMALPAGDRALGFFNCWTRKEAFVKAVGDGLSHPLDSFSVSLIPSEPAAIVRVGDTPGAECGWCLESFVPAPLHVAAVVVRTDPASLLA
jgi:4'-phosphopantetheinyl transferase